MIAVLWSAAALAMLPALLMLANLAIWRRDALTIASTGRASVLIPARNEAHNIGPALDAVLASRFRDLEVIVLDDASEDATAAVVTDRARSDPRVRLLRSRPLPSGVAGKPFACAQLAAAATSEVLIFIDADVRLAPHAVGALVGVLQQRAADLISGVPRQITGTLAERLLVPLIHFVLLGFLPFGPMRMSHNPALGAACGQMLAVRRTAYRRCGGHLANAGAVHDALALARTFRRHGLKTDLCDATGLAACRMYRGWRETFAGLAKNAHEGLGSRRGIVPWSLMLLGGQCLPLAALPWVHGPRQWTPALIALAAAFGSRAILAVRFRQPWVGVLAHPVSITLLVAIQWYALARRAAGQPVLWKGRPPPSLTSDA